VNLAQRRGTGRRRGAEASGLWAGENRGGRDLGTGRGGEFVERGDRWGRKSGTENTRAVGGFEGEFRVATQRDCRPMEIRN